MAEKRKKTLAALTLNDVGNHEGGAGVVADEITTGEVAFDLQRKQIPGGRKTEVKRQRERVDDIETHNREVNRLMHAL